MVIDARMAAASREKLYLTAKGKYDAIRYELARKNVGIEDDSGDEDGATGGTFATLDVNDIAEELGRGLGTGGADGEAPAADVRPETR